jgi:hypothetical protein
VHEGAQRWPQFDQCSCRNDQSTKRRRDHAFPALPSPSSTVRREQQQRQRIGENLCQLLPHTVVMSSATLFGPASR